MFLHACCDITDDSRTMRVHYSLSTHGFVHNIFKERIVYNLSHKQLAFWTMFCFCHYLRISNCFFHRLLNLCFAVDDAAQHDKSEHSIVYTGRTAGRRRCREKEAGKKCQEKEAGRRCKEKAIPSTSLSCPPVGRSRSIKYVQ